MSAEPMESKNVRRPSVCGIDYMWRYCMDFFQISFVASPGPYALMLFSLLKNIYIFFTNILALLDYVYDYLRFQRLTSRKAAELGHMLLIKHQ